MLWKTMSEEKTLQKIINREKEDWCHFMWINRDPDGSKMRVKTFEYICETLRIAMWELIFPYLPSWIIVSNQYVVENLIHPWGVTKFPALLLKKNMEVFDNEEDADQKYCDRLLEGMAEYLSGSKRVDPKYVQACLLEIRFSKVKPRRKK